VTVDIYIDVLLRLSKDRSFQIFVHPIVPVLNETRHTVKLFNQILQHKVEQTKQLRWLDFFPQLLSSTGDFNKEYELDGTHMNPKYVHLLETAMQKHE